MIQPLLRFTRGWSWHSPHPTSFCVINWLQKKKWVLSFSLNLFHCSMIWDSFYQVVLFLFPRLSTEACLPCLRWPVTYRSKGVCSLLQILGDLIYLRLHLLKQMLLGWSLVAQRPTSTSWAVQTLEWPSQDEPSHRMMTNACWFKLECRWVYYATHNQPMHLVCLDLVPEHIFESTNVITDLIWSAHGVLLDWCWVRRPQFLGLLLPPGWFLTTGLCLLPVFHQILFDICFDRTYKYWWRFRI